MVRVVAEPGSSGETQTADGPPRSSTAVEGQDRLGAGELLAGRYQVESEVGRGGGGTVYRAFDQGAQVPVALKLLVADRRPASPSSEQLYRELRFGRSIQHPNVCRIYDVFEAQGRHLLAMEYASARTLRATLRERGGERPFDEQLADARGVIAGLAAIHRSGLIHRDLKPENILRMGDGRLVVSDFGLARALDQTTVTTGLAGTPGYVAPETLTGSRHSQAADVWSLGVVLHEILRGERPEWAGLQRPPLLGAASGSDAREAAVLRVCRACLDPDPNHRLASALEVEALLDRSLRSGSGGQRWPRWLGLLALAAAAAAVGGLVALVRGQAPSPPPPTARAPAGSTDWSRSRVIIRQPGTFCLEPLTPHGQTVRAVSPETSSAYDFDAARGRWTAVPAPTERGCMVPSPDGKTMLFSRRLPGGANQVMLVAAPGEGEATPLLRGSHARWLPSGVGMFYATESQRPALADTAGHLIHQFDEGPAPFEIRDTAVDERGDRAAVLAHYRLPVEQTRIELFDLRARRRLGGWKLAASGARTVKFDPTRQTFQFSEETRWGWRWSEVTKEGEVAGMGVVPGQNIVEAVRAGGGFVFMVGSRESFGRLYRIGPGRAEQYVSARAQQFKTSASGDLVYAQLDRLEKSAIVVRRAQPPMLSLTDIDRYAHPDISADGRTVVFMHEGTGELFACDLSAEDFEPSRAVTVRPWVLDGKARESCRLTGVDHELYPQAGLALHPAGDRLGYVAQGPPAGKGPRLLRVLSLKNHQARDLGSIDDHCRAGCQIYWPSPEVIRICPAQGATVTDVDVASGRPRTRTVTGDPGHECEPPTPAPYRYELRAREMSELRFVPDLPAE